MAKKETTAERIRRLKAQQSEKPVEAKTETSTPAIPETPKEDKSVEELEAMLEEKKKELKEAEKDVVDQPENEEDTIEKLLEEMDDERKYRLEDLNFKQQIVIQLSEIVKALKEV